MTPHLTPRNIDRIETTMIETHGMSS